MERATALFCADIDPPRYKVLDARGQLPFRPNVDPVTGRRVYTLDESFRLRLMHDLIGGEGNEATLTGLGPEFAARAVINLMGYFPRHPLAWVGPVDWWAGAVVFEDEYEDRTDRWTAWFAGEFSFLPAWIEERAARPPAADGSDRGKSRVVRVLVANASRAADFVRERAMEENIWEIEANSMFAQDQALTKPAD